MENVERAAIPYNRGVMKWARERLRLRVEDAAKRTNVTVQKVYDWENGEAAPTVRQARSLADLYDRPFLEFLSPEIPILPQTYLAPDFRFHRIGPSETEEVALKGVQEWAETQRQNAIDLYAEIGDVPDRLPPNIRAKIEDDSEIAAKRVRAFLRFPIKDQFSLTSKTRGSLPSIFRGYIEAANMLVFKQSGLSALRTRGICLYDDVLPVIIYGNESPGGQAFTLAHELGHVVLGKSAISGAPRLGQLGANGKRIEGWCNSFAAAFLMPSGEVIKHEYSPKQISDSITDFALDKLAKTFAVSQHAMLIRLVTIGLVRTSYYWRIKRPQFLAQEASYSAGGRPLYYGSRYRNSLGDRYTGLVLEALETGRIGHHTASEFMGIKNVRHLLDIQENFAR